MKNKKDSIIKGALILTIAGLISRVLGFLYRIYMSNLIGSEGMGVYQLIFPIFMICYTVCCSGLFTAISKLVAAERAKNNVRNMSRVVNGATLISFCLSIILFVILYFNGKYISHQLLNEPRTLLSLKVLAITIPFTAISSSVKGYFYGLKKTIIPASAQLIEQIIRILVVYCIASLFMPMGLEYACAMAVIGMAVGEILTCFYVIITYRISLSHSKGNNRHYSSYRKIIRRITTIAIPLTANRVLITLLQSIETILIPSRLKIYGLSHTEAMSIYGVLSGMALPLIMFPSVFTNSLSMMLLPTVSEAQASKNKKSISYTTSKTLQYTLMIGIASTCLFIVFGNPLGTKIYNEAFVGTLLITLAWLCPFIYLNTTLSSILNGLDYEMITFRNNSIGLGIRIIFTIFVIPLFGLKGYLWGLLISFLAVALLDIIKIVKITKVQFNISKWLFKPILAALCVSLTIRYTYYNYIYPNTESLFVLLITCGIFGLSYFFLLIILRCIPKKDLRNVKHSI
ncbi:MAG: stage V sporulation protein B [Eubacteriales bacterium]